MIPTIGPMSQDGMAVFKEAATALVEVMKKYPAMQFVLVISAPPATVNGMWSTTSGGNVPPDVRMKILKAALVNPPVVQERFVVGTKMPDAS